MLLVQRTLETCNNPFVAAYKNLHKVQQDEMFASETGDRLPRAIRMQFKAGPDSRRYYAPTHDDVAAVFVGNDGSPGKQDICVYPRLTTR